MVPSVISLKTFLPPSAVKKRKGVTTSEPEPPSPAASFLALKHQESELLLCYLTINPLATPVCDQVPFEIRTNAPASYGA